MANDIEVSVGYEDIQTLRRELVGIAKDAKTSASVFEREYNKVERVLNANAKASQTYYASVLKLDQASKSASSSASVFVKALNEEAKAVKELAQVEKDLIASRAKLDATAKQEANTLDQLKSKYQAGYAEMKLYKAENEQLNLAYKKNILTAAQLKIEQDKLSASFATGTGVFGNYGKGVNQTRGYTNQLGVITQQAGYQFGDFFVQLQGGTNVFVALGQQATQLVGTFAAFAKTTKMIAIFSGLGIAIPIITAIAAAFSRSSEEANKTKEALTEFEEKIKSITNTLKEYILTKKAAASGMTVDELFGVQNVDEAVKKVEAARAALKKISSVGFAVGKFGGFTYYQKNAAKEQEKKAVEDLIAAEKVLADLRKKQSEEREKTFLKEVRNLDQELNLQKTIIKFGEESTQVEAMKYAQKLVNIRAELDERVKLGELERSQADALFAYYKKLADSATTLEDKVGQAYLDALNLGKADVSSGINKAAEAARLLAKDMGISLSAAMDIINVASLADKGGYAFMTGPSYDASNTRSGATGNQDTSSYTPSMAAQAARKLREWQAANPIPEKDKTSGGGGAVAGRVDTQEEYLAKLAREYDMKKKSLGLTDDQIKRSQFLFTLDEKIATMKTKRTELEIETERKRAVAAYDAYVAAERQDALMGVVNSNINSAFMAMVDGSATVADAFRNMMFNILKSVYEQTVTQPAANAITGLLKGFLGGGGGPQTGSLGLPSFKFANGGVVGSPTTFSMSGGKTGLMGEAGPEAIMPLKRGSNGQLGVQVQGGSGGMTVNNNITVTGSDAAAVRMEVAKMIPQITNATKAAIIDAKRRGGQMGAAFQ